MQSDSELYQGFLAGRDEYLEQLMALYGDELMYYINGYIHDLDDSEDLMIEAFARIMLKRPKIEEGKFKAYLFKTGRHLAARFHSIFSRAEVFNIDDLEMEPADPEILEESVAGEEQKEALRECIHRLDHDMQEAIWLVYFRGMSYRDAATVMQVTEKRIDHLLDRSKKKLREEMEKEGYSRGPG